LIDGLIDADRDAAAAAAADVLLAGCSTCRLVDRQSTHF